MSKVVAEAREQVRERILSALGEAIAAGELPAEPMPAFGIEVPGDRAHGDLSANVAMVSARAFKRAPRQIADCIAAHLMLKGTYLEKAEVAGPGFLNFFLSPAFYADVVADVLDKREAYGRSDYGHGKKVMVEFVSANPTGPMHMGNARGGALGDCLAAVLEAAGYDVWREFYVNDAGNQIEKFAVSLETRYLQIYKGEDAVVLPEDAYQGEDIKEHAAAFAAEYGDQYVDADAAQRRKALVDFALPKNIDKMHRDMEKYRIRYDQWFLESTLHESGEVQATIDLLTERGMTYEKDGALWYKNKELLTKKLLAAGKTQAEIDKLELKDDVLVRVNGNPTYFAADIAYHRNKFARGFDTCIDVWGADHHGHVARMKGAMDAVGLDGDKLQVVLIQLVRLMRGGEVARMSKRSGKAIQLADLLDEVPVDAARFFFNQREANTRMDFDLDLAIEQSSSNPVYYVQYAHARICTLLKNLEAEGYTVPAADAVDFSLLTDETEQALIKQIASYGQVVLLAARDYDPSHINRYLTALAAAFHKFYAACRIKGEEKPVLLARLKLADTTRAVLKNAMTLIGCSAPEKM